MREYLTKEEARRFLEYGHNPRDHLVKRVMLHTGMRLGEVAALKKKDIDLEGRQVFVGRTTIDLYNLGKVNTASAKGYHYWNPKRKMTVWNNEGEEFRGTVEELSKMGLKGEGVKKGTKGNDEGRTVPLVDQETLEMLNLHLKPLEEEDFIFISNRSSRLSKTQIYRLVVRDLKAVGITPAKCHPHILRHTYSVSWLNAGGDLRSLQLNLGHSKIDTTAIYLRMTAQDRVSKAEGLELGY